MAHRLGASWLWQSFTKVRARPRPPGSAGLCNVWRFIRDNRLSNRVFPSYADILDPCCTPWNTLLDQSWRVMSVGLRDWAIRF